MNSKDFFDLVARMRAKQKEYFKYRWKSTLDESKRLEKAVDAEIERVRKEEHDRQNPTLW